MKITLKDARKLRKMTQQTLANESGVHIRQIQRIESGDSDIKNITAYNLISLCNALDIDPRDLIDLGGEK